MVDKKNEKFGFRIQTKYNKESNTEEENIKITLSYSDKLKEIMQKCCIESETNYYSNNFPLDTDNSNYISRKRKLMKRWAIPDFSGSENNLHILFDSELITKGTVTLDITNARDISTMKGRFREIIHNILETYYKYEDNTTEYTFAIKKVEEND